MPPTRRYRLGLFGLLLAAAALRLPHLDYDLPRLYEEATPMRQAWEMWNWEGSGLDLNPHFFNYPAFYFYIQLLGQMLYFAFGWLAGRFVTPDDLQARYLQNPTEIVLLARSINVAFGVAAVAAMARFGRRLAGPTTGLIAAALLAVSPLHIQVSRTILVDTPLLFFAVLALSSIVRVQRGDRRAVWLTGLWVGLAAACKYTGALLLIPFVAAYVLKPGPAADVWRRPALWIGLAVSGLTFLAASPYCILDFAEFWKDFSLERGHMADGHFGLDPSATVFAYSAVLWSNVGPWLVLPLLLGFAFRLTERPRATEWVPPWIYTGAYLGIISTWSMHATHYLLPALPGLLVTTARGFDDLRHRIGRIVPLPNWSTTGGLAVLLILPVGLPAARRATSPPPADPRTEAEAWIRSNVPRGALIARESYTPELEPADPESPDYLTVLIPMNVLHPERSSPYYDMRWYAPFDYVVTSDDVVRRYRADPRRFPAQNRFYENLTARWSLAAEFQSPSRDAVRVHRNPGVGSQRPDLPLPVALFGDLDGAEAFQFLDNLAVVFKQRGWRKTAAGAYAGALDACERALSITPDDRELCWKGTRYYLELKRDGEAVAHLTRALRRWPQDPDFLMGLGFAYKRLGDSAAAERTYAQVTERAAKAARMFEQLGASYYLDEDLRNAVRAWSAGLRADPENLTCTVNLGSFHHQRGNQARAAELWEKAYQSHPHNLDLVYNLLLLYRERNDMDSALRLLTAAVRRHPDHRELRAALTDLEARQNRP